LIVSKFPRAGFLALKRLKGGSGRGNNYSRSMDDNTGNPNNEVN